MKDGICPHCARRRRLTEIHPTAGGFVARFDYAPCNCPGTQRANAKLFARRQVAVFAIPCCGATMAAGVLMASGWLLIVGGAGVLIALMTLGLNQPAR